VKGAEKEIKTVDFNMSREESDALYENGAEAAKKFIKGWDFEQWKQLHREPLGKKKNKKKNRP
jgi:NTE family protein